MIFLYAFPFFMIFMFFVYVFGCLMIFVFFLTVSLMICKHHKNHYLN